MRINPRSSLPVAIVASCVFALCGSLYPFPNQGRGVAAAQTEASPFVVKVLTENDQGLGNMNYRDMAKLVTFMFASGAPAGSYDQARAAGIKTVWYVDPHRIGDVPGKMSDRPPITSLDRDRDLMKCSGGGYLDSTYATNNGTVFGDPTSPNLIAKTNAQLASAAGHYGKIDYLWKDDSMLLTDQWADSWYCGNAPPALPTNGGNGMKAAGHGRIDGARIVYGDRSAYTPQRFITDLAKFDERIEAPVIDEGACIGDGTALGGSEADGGATATLVAQSKNTVGALCENFAEGWGNRQTLDGKAVDRYWEQDLNSGVQVISAGKMFISYEYIGNEGEQNRGHVVDIDQRGFIYASFMLLFNYDHSIYKTGTSGAQLKTAAPVIVFPENLLVPARPLATAVWPQRIAVLNHNGAYVREFAACAYAGKPIGPCAAIVNPSSTATVPMPALQQSYGHHVRFTGNNGAFTGRYGTPNYGDTGDLDFQTAAPGTLPPAGWAILAR
jgi:hypothetical protein